MRRYDVVPAVLGDGERYATWQEVKDARDLAEVDIRIKRWRRPDGSALVLRARALGFDEQAWVDGFAGRGEARDESKFLAAVWHKAILLPATTLDQAEAICRKNASIVRAIVDFLWDLGDLDQAEIDDALAELTRAITDAGPDTEPADTLGS